MNLYQISWSSSVLILDFYSPQFLEAPNELEALSEFVKLFKSTNAKEAPRDIKLKEVCKINKIFKYQ